ncbi:MAG: OsmC family protein [Pseudomonadales bacterium]|nr:OsmC family protein [Pseudomonadales bacterium]
MAKYKAIIHWEKGDDQQESYSWTFENGIVLHNTNNAMLASPGVIDPESAFVASVASCHMLSLFAIAAKHGLSIQHYHDEAVGVLEKNAEGRIAITRVLLRPDIQFHSDKQPTDLEVSALHDEANRNCFIGNSIKTSIHIES